MKNLLKRVMSIAAATALLMTSVISASAADHNHKDGTSLNEGEETTKNTGDYTITLTYPTVKDKTYEFDTTNSHFGAYQIFSGTVPKVGEDGYPEDSGAFTNPGTDSTSLPLTDIKWGKAFKTKDVILEFIYALADAPTNVNYGYAFKDFTGFDGFFDTSGKLDTKYTTDGTSVITVTATSVTGDTDNVNFDKLAVEVADVLTKHSTDHEWLQAFNDILGGYAGKDGSEEPGAVYHNKAYATDYYEGFVGTEASHEAATSEYYTIYVPAGYYMIRDLSTIKDTDTSHAFSARMLFVANDIQQILKVDVPKLDKEILRDGAAVGSAGNKTDVAGVGDVVHFQLKGTLPSNFDEYLGGYQYTFIDTLSKGLDLVQYDGDHADYSASTGTYVKVTVKGLYKWDTGSSQWVWDDEVSSKLITLDSSTIDFKDTTIPDKVIENEHHLGTETGQYNYNYLAKYITTATDSQLSVAFPCLKEIRIKGTAENGLTVGTYYRLGYNTLTETSSEIYVDYYAKVNQNAVVSPAVDSTTRNGNFNKAQIEYSDNPQAYADTDKTVVNNAYVYTFGLDIVKIDAAEFLRNGEDEATLKGVKFVLVRPKADTLTEGKTTDDTTWEIAKFETVDPDVDAEENLPQSFKNNGYYTIREWVKIDDTHKGATFNEEWLPSSLTDYQITTLAGGVLNVSGLDVGVTYTMVETEAPTKDYDDTTNAYAKIPPFTITLSAEKTGVVPHDEYTGKLSSATSDQETKDSFSLEKPVKITDKFEGEPASETDGSAKMLVANFKYTDLPSTGGIGVYIYYIAGGCAVVLALVLFALSKKKRSDK